MGVARGRCWAAGVVAGVLACVLAVAPSASADVPSAPVVSGGASQCVPDKSTIAQCFPDKALAQEIAKQVKYNAAKTGEVLTSKDVQGVYELVLGNTLVASVQGLQVFTNLGTLDLSKTQVSDVSPLAGMTSLRYLHLSGTRVSDVSPLAGLANLYWLDLSKTQVSDVSPLAGLANLYSLDLSGTRVSDVSPLVKLTKLGYLHLSKTQVSNVSPLAKLTNLGVLELSKTQVSDVSPLAKLTNLGGLDLSGTQVSDVSPLAKLVKLGYLGLSETRVSDVSPLVKLTKLDYLVLSGTRVSDATLPLVAKLTNFSGYLDLSKTQVSDASALAKLTKLGGLDLSGTRVSNVSPLAKLANLQQLFLRDTQVSDVSPLAKLTKLWDLELSGTRVSDVSSLAGLANLSYLVLSGTQVSDVSSLAKLTDLDYLDLSGTRVLDLGVLHGLPLRGGRDGSGASVTSFAGVRPSVKLTVEGDGSVSMPAPRWLDGTVVAPLSTSPAGGVLDVKRGVVTWKKYDAGASYSYDFKKSFTLNDGGAKEFSGRVSGVKPAASVVFRDVSSSTPHAEDIVWLADAGVSTGWREPDGSYSFRGMDSVKRQDMAAFLYREASRRGAAGVPAGAGYARFRDVTGQTPHAQEIGWLADANVSTGWREPDGSYSFRGMDPVRRQDMAAFLRREARLMGVEDASSWRPSDADWRRFRDVTKQTPHAEDILWLAHANVSKGYADGTFGGMLPVYRQDMAAFLHRLDGLKK